jgi:hypothetical protein
MRQFLIIGWLGVLWLAAGSSGCAADGPGPGGLSSQDVEYVQTLASDTWQCIDYFRSPATGLPYDSNFWPEKTNTTNVGLYLISVVGAEKMGFITSAQARQRVTQVLKSLKRIQHYRGFFNNQLDVSGKTKAVSGENALSDYNKLPAAFLILRQAYPDLKDADELFRRIDWSFLYDSRNNRMALGFDVTSGTPLFWGDGWLMSDSRTGVFLAVATGGVPAECFHRLERKKAKQFGVEFYHPAWEFAGLFMHAMEGLLSDERATALGLSAANYAYAQIQFARARNHPAWGWSACDIPDVGYTIDGHLSEMAVTPHASALMISYYPRKVVQNLRTLERLGCRPPYRENGKEYAFGFRDSINLTTGDVSELYFTSLDQTMLFIALVNFLQDGAIWRLYEKDPVVQNGVAKLREYQEKDPGQLRLYAQRDAGNPARVSNRPGTLEPLVVDQAENQELNHSEQARSVRCENASPEAFRMSVVSDGQHDVVKVDYDLSHSPHARCALVEPLNLDADGYNAVAFRCRGENPQKLPMDFRLTLHDGLDSKNTGFVDDIGPDWQEIVLPLEAFRGVVADTSQLSSLEFLFEMAPEFMPGNRLGVAQGSIYLDNVRLLSLSREQIKDCLQNSKRARQLTVASDGSVEGLNRPTGWMTFKDTSASLAFRINEHEQTMLVDYDLGSGKWVSWEKMWRVSPTKDFRLAFDFKATGSDNQLEVKLFSDTGAVYGVKLKFKGKKEWQHVMLSRQDLKRLWGGKPQDQLENVQRFGFAVSEEPGTQGAVEIRNLSMKR